MMELILRTKATWVFLAMRRKRSMSSTIPLLHGRMTKTRSTPVNTASTLASSS